MAKLDIGNKLNQIIFEAAASMFDQGELATLTFRAFEIAATQLEDSDEQEITLKFPIGYTEDKTTIDTDATYTKDALHEKYLQLADHQLCINAIVQLVTIVETMLGDLIRAVILEYPNKLSNKRAISIQEILESESIEEIHLRAIDAYLNEIFYKSPADFAECLKQLLSINLLDCNSFGNYLEIKASRDIYIHNKGVVNDIYLRKSGDKRRVKVGDKLPATMGYFLESYEHCLTIVDWLEIQLHKHWPSSEYERNELARKEKSMQV